jgi:hypothetical protein
MKRLVLAVACLALGAGLAYAGPNAGVVLTAHGDQTGDGTSGDPDFVCDLVSGIPTVCEDLVQTAMPSGPTGRQEYFVILAVGASDLCFKTVTFGVDYVPDEYCYIRATVPCRTDLGRLALPTTDPAWPGPGSGISISWAPNERTGLIVPVMLLEMNNFYGQGNPTQINLAPHPAQPSGVVSCDEPPESDDFEGYATLGTCGADGVPACPVLPEIGACCLPTGECVEVTQEECESDPNNEWVGGPCEPDTCLPPTATQQTTWGQIKTIYR